MRGNNLSNTIIGGIGNDTLDSHEGAPDLLKGGAGDDVYYLRNAGDVIDFSDGRDAGNDTVHVLSVNIGNAEAVKAYVEHLWAHGIETVWVDGQIYTPPPINNTYYIRFGSDTIGEDTAASGGFDTAYIFIPEYDLQDDVGVEVLAVGETVTDGIKISGNRFDNTIIGGQGGDHLIGEAGEDSITGAAGNDSLEGGDDNDTLNGGADNDTLMVVPAAIFCRAAPVTTSTSSTSTTRSSTRAATTIRWSPPRPAPTAWSASPSNMPLPVRRPEPCI
ncbi:calcium-binding protein [Microvirga aerilata]|uniref:calcium-binding protein n=1 Tax=Microvirga aerilata TaxID=670292 RepID=UPI0036334418